MGIPLKTKTLSDRTAFPDFGRRMGWEKICSVIATNYTDFSRLEKLIPKVRPGLLVSLFELLCCVHYGGCMDKMESGRAYFLCFDFAPFVYFEDKLNSHLSTFL
jgi:hypothetical protein